MIKTMLRSLTAHSCLLPNLLEYKCKGAAPQQSSSMSAVTYHSCSCLHQLSPRRWHSLQPSKYGYVPAQRHSGAWCWLSLRLHSPQVSRTAAALLICSRGERGESQELLAPASRSRVRAARSLQGPLSILLWSRSEPRQASRGWQAQEVCQAQWRQRRVARRLGCSLQLLTEACLPIGLTGKERDMRAVAMSMRTGPPPRPPMRTVAVAAAGAAVGATAAGWALARRQQQQRQQVQQLHVAVEANDGEAVQQLLEAAANMRAATAARDEDGRTPLHLAALHGKEKAAAALLQADPKAASRTDSQGATPLFLAAQQGHEALVAELLKAEHIETSTPAGKQHGWATPAHVAAAGGHTGVLKRILEADETASFWEDLEVRRLCVMLHAVLPDLGSFSGACLFGPSGACWHPCPVLSASKQPFLPTPVLGCRAAHRWTWLSCTASVLRHKCCASTRASSTRSRKSTCQGEWCHIFTSRAKRTALASTSS